MKLNLRATTEQRVQWLVDHQPLWINLTKADLRGTESTRKRLFKQMVAAGLFAPTTFYQDVSLTSLTEQAACVLLDKGLLKP